MKNDIHFPVHCPIIFAKKDSIVALHFITQALGKVLSDADLFNVTGGVFTTVHRKQDWMQRGMRNGKV